MLLQGGGILLVDIKEVDNSFYIGESDKDPLAEIVFCFKKSFYHEALPPSNRSNTREYKLLSSDLLMALLFLA